MSNQGWDVRWVVGTIVIVMLGTALVSDAIRALIVDDEWWQLPVLPIAVVGFGWMAAGALLRRGRRRQTDGTG